MTCITIIDGTLQKLLEQFVGLEQQQAVTQSIVQEAVLVERARNAELVKELELQALQNSSQVCQLATPHSTSSSNVVVD